jgi:hypothetical protein
MRRGESGLAAIHYFAHRNIAAGFSGMLQVIFKVIREK